MKEVENARVAIRNIGRDANSRFKDFEKERDISEDQQHRAEERVQKLTNKHIAAVESAYQVKEQDLLSFWACFYFEGILLRCASLTFAM